MIITKDYKMGDAILHDPKILTVLTRFNVKLGFGDETIEQICVKNNINVDFFLELANTFHDKNYFTENKLKSFSLQLIVSYLINSHKIYVGNKIPEIEELINTLKYDNEQDAKNIIVLKKFFSGYKDELINHIKHEELNVYPYILELEIGLENKKVSETFFERMLVYSASDYRDEHSDVELKLFDLKNIIIKYLPPPINFEKCNVILNKLFKLDEDLKNHSKLEERILVPNAIKIEAELKKLKSENKIDFI